MNKLGTLAAAAMLATLAGNVQAQDYSQRLDEPSASEMAFDLLLVRPLSLVATVAGTGLFVVSLPFSLFQWETPAEPARKFIVEPARYTFTRPLGEME